MKLATVEARFHDLKGKCDFTGRGKAGKPAAAIARAFADLFKQKGVRGKRIHTLTTKISIIEMIEPQEVDDTHNRVGGSQQDSQ